MRIAIQNNSMTSSVLGLMRLHAVMRIAIQNNGSVLGLGEFLNSRYTDNCMKHLVYRDVGVASNFANRYKK